MIIVQANRATIKTLNGFFNPHRRFTGVFKRKKFPKPHVRRSEIRVRCQCNYCGEYHWILMSAYKLGCIHEPCHKKVFHHEKFINEVNESKNCYV